VDDDELMNGRFDGEDVFPTDIAGGGITRAAVQSLCFR
jgi:hypothetical protein